MSIQLGSTPEELRVVLSRAAGFSFGLRAKDVGNGGGELPEGLEVELVFGNGTRWPAAVSGPLIQWDISTEQVNQLLNASTAYNVDLLWNEPGHPSLLWATGRISVVR